MDNSSQSVLETLRTVEFRLGLKGYNVDEVDEYLEKAAAEAESVLEQLRTAAERLRQANERIGQLEVELQKAPAGRSPERPAERPAEAPPASDDALQRTLVLAQRFVEQAKRESESEAAEVVSRAEERARALVEQAEERARRISAESEQRLRDEVARLETTRNRLAADVESMAKHLDEQRLRVRETFAEAIKWLDERMAPAVRPSGADAGRGGAAAERRGADGGSGAAAAASAAPGQHGAPATATLPDAGPSTQPVPAPAGAGAATASSSRLAGVSAELFENRRPPQ